MLGVDEQGALKFSTVPPLGPSLPPLPPLPSPGVPSLAAQVGTARRISFLWKPLAGQERVPREGPPVTAQSCPYCSVSVQ